MPKRRAWADLALLLVAFIWGVSFVIQRMAAAEMQAYVFNGVRFLLGALVILPFALIKARFHLGSKETGRKTTGFIPRKYLTGVVLTGLLLASGSAFQQVGLIYTTASNAGFITGLYVVFVPIFLTFGGRRRVPRLMIWIAAFLSALGLYFLSAGGRLQI